MARLSQIEIRESELTYSNQRDWSFRHTGHHVCELLLHYIGRDFILDGSSKFSATFGPRPEYDPPFNTVLGVTSYYVEDFDVAEHMTRPVEEQQEAILTGLVRVMTQAAQAADNVTAIVDNAAAEVRNSNFGCEIPVKKLARSTKDRRLRVHVFRCLGPHLGEVWEVRVCTRNGAVLAVIPITECPDYLDRTERYSRSAWSSDNNTYQITNNRLGAIEFTLDVSPYLGNASQYKADETSQSRKLAERDRVRRIAISQAEEAFRARDYQAILRLLMPFDAELKGSIAAKLAFARKIQSEKV